MCTEWSLSKMLWHIHNDISPSSPGALHSDTVLNKIWELNFYLYDNVSINTMNKCIETLMYNALVNKYKRYV